MHMFLRMLQPFFPFVKPFFSLGFVGGPIAGRLTRLETQIGGTHDKEEESDGEGDDAPGRDAGIVVVTTR